MGRDDHDDDKKPAGPSSIESWLASRLGEVDEDPMDSDEISFTEAEEVFSESVEFPDPDPSIPELEIDPDEPSVPELGWDPELSPTPTPLPGREEPPAAQALRDSADPAPRRRVQASRGVRDGDTLPLPPAPDPWASAASQGTDLSEPPPGSGAPTRPTPADDPELDELLRMDSERPSRAPREDSLPDPDLIARLERRMPGRSFDEVFPHPPRGQGERENTAALLAGLAKPGRRDARTGEETATAVLDLLEIDDEAAPNNIHTEPTHVNMPPPGFADYDPALDEPTVIARPKGSPPTPRPTGAGRSSGPTTDHDSPYSASMLAWGASTFGVLLFGVLVIAVALAAAQYYDVLDLEVLDLDLLPGRRLR